MKKTLLALLLCFTAHSCFAVIIESDKLTTILDYIKPGKKNLVIFDLDNTLIIAPTDVGSDQWFTHELVQSKKSIEEVLPVYLKLQEKISLELTECDAPEILSKLIEKNVTVIGLTARSPELEPRTISELNRLGLRFSHILSHDDVVDRKFHYHSGVVFVGSRDKGEVLKDVLKDAQLQFDEAVMADDKRKYLDSVEKTLEDAGIEFTGIRYSGMDERVKNFNPIHAERERKQLLGE